MKGRTTAEIQEKLLEPEEINPPKKVCCSRIWNKLLNSPNLLWYQNWNNKVKEFLSTCYMTSVITADFAAATGLSSISVLSDIGAFEPVFLGACWGGALLSIPIAAYFAKADADCHEMTSQQIDQSRELENLDNLEKGLYDPKGMPSIADVSIEGKPVGVTPPQFRMAITHLFNDAFKTMNDYLVYVKGLEEKLNPYPLLPTWMKPAIKVTYYAAFFTPGILGNGQEFKNSLIAIENKNKRERIQQGSPTFNETNDRPVRNLVISIPSA